MYVWSFFLPFEAYQSADVYETQAGDNVTRYATDLADIRGPHTSSPCCLPFNSASGGVETTSCSWGNGMRTLGYYWFGGWAGPRTFDPSPALTVTPPSLQPPDATNSSLSSHTEGRSCSAGSLEALEVMASEVVAAPEVYVPHALLSRGKGKGKERELGWGVGADGCGQRQNPPATEPQGDVSDARAQSSAQANSSPHETRATGKRVWIKHVFTCNLAHLQKFAGELVARVQMEVELVRRLGESTSASLPFLVSLRLTVREIQVRSSSASIVSRHPLATVTGRKPRRFRRYCSKRLSSSRSAQVPMLRCRWTM